MTLTFNEANHRYRLDGRAVPSVTTIINGGLPKPALITWAARTVAEAIADNAETADGMLARLGRAPMIEALAAVPNERRNVAAARGTAVHELAERVAHGEAVPVPPEMAAMVRGYVEWLDAFEPEVLHTEVPVANRTFWYAGKFDLYVQMCGIRWLLDVKTSRSVYGDTSLQLAGYAGAQVMIVDDTERPMPPVDRIGVLHVTNEGTDLFDLGNWREAFEEFVAARTIYAGAGRRRKLIGDPLTPADVTWVGVTS